MYIITIMVYKTDSVGLEKLGNMVEKLGKGGEWGGVGKLLHIGRPVSLKRGKTGEWGDFCKMGERSREKWKKGEKKEGQLGERSTKKRGVLRNTDATKTRNAKKTRVLEKRNAKEEF